MRLPEGVRGDFGGDDGAAWGLHRHSSLYVLARKVKRQTVCSVPVFLPVGRNLAKLAFDFLPVGKLGLQAFDFQLLFAFSFAPGAT